MILPLLVALMQEAQPPVQQPPPASEQNKPTPNPDTSRLPPVQRGGAIGLATGRIMIEGEGRLPDKALVEVVCPGQSVRTQLTDDRFDIPVAPLQTGDAVNQNTSSLCQLTITLSGYLPVIRSVNASQQNNLGLVLLKPRPGIKGFSYSSTSLLAPAEARKLYEKGLAAAQRKRTQQAREAWEQAVKIHPKYAIAWMQLGVLHRAEGRSPQARQAFEQAMAADKQYLLPLLHLAALASGERNWKEAANLTDRLIDQNPLEFPEAYVYNAAAFYNLGHPQPAELSVKRAIELDVRHEYPRAHQLYGILLADQNKPKEAAEQFRLFLKYAPKSPDAAGVRARLADLEKAGR
jgi:tetratricopeptide (TPR) repeat protein